MKEAMEKDKVQKKQVKKIKSTIQQIETRGANKKKTLEATTTIVTPAWSQPTTQNGNSG
jgi:hypothetical protein